MASRQNHDQAIETQGANTTTAAGNKERETWLGNAVDESSVFYPDFDVVTTLFKNTGYNVARETIQYQQSILIWPDLISDSDPYCSSGPRNDLQYMCNC